jgi:hypothetical protein
MSLLILLPSPALPSPPPANSEYGDTVLDGIDEWGRVIDDLLEEGEFVFVTEGVTSITVGDTLALAEATPSLLARMTLAEALGLLAALPSGTPKAYLTLAQSLGLADAAAVKALVSLADSMALADATPGVKVTFSLGEVLGLSEILGVKASLLLSETLSLADAVSVYTGVIQKLVTDALALTEAPSIRGYVALTDTLALAETIALKLFKAISDSLGLADATPGIVARMTVAQTLGLVDILPSGTPKVYFSLAETLGLAEATPIKAYLALADTLALAETITPKLFKAVADALALTETLSLKGFVSLTQSLNLFDALATIANFTVADALSLTDATPTIKAFLLVTQALGVVGALPSGTPKVYLSLAEALGVAESLGVDVSFTLAAVLALAETASGKNLVAVQQGLSITDALQGARLVVVTDKLGGRVAPSPIFSV